jgi:aconitate hydratase
MNSFDARSLLHVAGRDYEIFRLSALASRGVNLVGLPYSIRILLENLLRHEDGRGVSADSVMAVAQWDAQRQPEQEIAFTPARVLLQDFTGVPALVDLAAMREAVRKFGGDPKKINPLQPVELVIDHSIQVDVYGTPQAFEQNEAMDYRRNSERYAFIKWARQAFENFTATPPNAGICHQVNLEYLARVVFGVGDAEGKGQAGLPQAYPDTLVGTDSHTPMVNGLGVLAWGVGGIEAEAAMLGQPISMLLPQVIGVRLTGALREGSTATDLVLTVAQMLRKRGVVGQFVEFFGPSLDRLSIADRATIGNMSPEYGSTCSIFPVDNVTIEYLRFTGRSPERIALVEAYMKEQGLFHSAGAPEPTFTDILHLDLSTVEPSVAGPRRPQDRIRLSEAKRSFQENLPSLLPPANARSAKTAPSGELSQGQAIGTWGEGATRPDSGNAGSSLSTESLQHGAVVIAAITSCTNTSNPSVMIAAGLLARNAVRRGLNRKPWVKTSLAPGSRVITDYYQRAGLTEYLDALGFHLTGYGCTTCIGNSGPLPAEVSAVIARDGLVVASVLSGNRNFEGRINSEVRANYLMSPPLVIAFAIAGRIDIDMYAEPLGVDANGEKVFLKDLWPSNEEVQSVIQSSISSQMYRDRYGRIYDGDARWNALKAPETEVYSWDAKSTYLRLPPYFEAMPKDAPETVPDISAARALAVLGDSVTTDHISPAGSIQKASPAGQYLQAHGVETADFNSYGARRGNHEVMVRGTLANPRIRNRLAPGVEGPFTAYLPAKEVLPIYDAAVRYQDDGTPLLIFAGKEYGSGSSRDWAAKGVYLQGVRAVIAESYERIHRSNLIGMGVLPLQFATGESFDSLQLSGEESFDVVGISELFRSADAARNRVVEVRAKRDGQQLRTFTAAVRLDTPQEFEYYRHGGILQYVLRALLSGRSDVKPSLVDSGITAPVQNPSTRRDVVEESSIESFPASDPPAY